MPSSSNAALIASQDRTPVRNLGPKLLTAGHGATVETSPSQALAEFRAENVDGVILYRPTRVRSSHTQVIEVPATRVTPRASKHCKGRRASVRTCLRLLSSRVLGVLIVGLLLLGSLAAAVTARKSTSVEPDVALLWDPLSPGNSWIYQEEARVGSMVHPEIERWKTKTTVTGSVIVPEGTLLTLQSKVFDHENASGPLTDVAKEGESVSHKLIHENCLYDIEPESIGPDNQLSQEFRQELASGNENSEVCFSLATAPAWRAEDQIATDGNSGASDPQVFRYASYLGSGKSVDRLFKKGVGFLHNVQVHQGSYAETDELLVATVIDGKTTEYPSTLLRKIPSHDYDCEMTDGNVLGWQHYEREDGTGFKSVEDCHRYQEIGK